MKIIVDIPEEVYKASQLINVKYEDVIQIPLECIANGTPINSSTDCVSRQASIDVVEKWFKLIKLNGDICCDGIRSLPSVTPERPRGKWIYKHNNWFCSNCGFSPFKGTGYVPSKDAMKSRWLFCNLCGADMSGKQALKYADNDTAFGGLQSAT